MVRGIPWRLFEKIGATAQSNASVEFEAGQRILRANLPPDQLWVAIKDILVYEDYEFLQSFRLSKMPVAATVLDAGAFVGLYSLRASQFARRVVSLEPSPRNYAYLTANLSLNKISNVEPHELALSSKEGISAFTEAGTISGFDRNGRHLVETTTLDDVAESLGRVDLLKMDIEGAEYDVFAASKLAWKRIAKITAEVHVYNEAHKIGLRKLVQDLRRNAFEVKVLWSPFQGIAYGITKPWKCALRRYNGRDPMLYRLMLSAIYGAGPLAGALKRSMEIGSEGLLFAYRE